MNCAIHTNVDATGFCRNCGRALCPTCTREVQGVLYCEQCLAEMVSRQHPVPAATSQVPAGPHPGLALFLGFIPGLGAVYNGEFTKALVHVVLFISIIVGLTSVSGGGATTALSLGLAAFIVYMAVDAHRVARSRLASAAASPASSESLDACSPNRLVGPILLILIGVLFLLNQFGWLSISRIADFWPVILIALGILMLGKRFWRAS